MTDRRTTPSGRYSVETVVDGEPVMLYDPQPRQDALHACPAPNILYGGQAGGGKSHALRWHGIMNCLRIPGLKALLLRRELTDLQKSHLLELPAEIAPLISAGVARWNEQKKTLTIRHKAGPDSVLVFGSCQYDKDAGAYLSSQWDLMMFDEASLFTSRMLRLLRTRLRSKIPGIRPQFVCGTNPGGEGHLWLYERFISKNPTTEPERGYDPSQWAFIPSRLEDNEYLDAVQYDQQFSGLSDAEYAAYRRGDWEAFAGQFFRHWSRAVHVVEPETYRDIQPHWTRGGCMDWGWMPNPGYVAFAAFDEYGRAWGYKELIFNECTPREVARMVGEGMVGDDSERVMEIVGDSQMWAPQPQNGVSIAAEINDEWAEMGLGLELVQANKDRRNGWARFHQWLKPIRPQPEDGKLGPWLRFLDNGEVDGVAVGCPYLINTIGSQMYDEKRMNGDMKKSSTDHGCDAWRYFLFAQEPLTPVTVVALSEVERRKKHFTRRMETAWAEHAEHLAAEHPVPEYEIPVAGDDYGATLGGGSSVAELFE